MSAVSSIFNEILVNNNFNNEFLTFWDKTNSKLAHSAMPAEVVVNSTDIAVLKGNVGTLQSQVSSLANDPANIAALQSSVSSITGTVTTATADITTLKTDVGTLQTQVSPLPALQSDVSTLKTDVSGLKITSTSTVNSVAQLATSVTELQAYDWSAHAATQNVSYGNHDVTNVDALYCNTLFYNALSPSIPAPIPFANTYYVDKAGSNSNVGSADFPFLTIQKAIDVCEAKFNGTAQEIRVNFGTYTENLLLKKARVQLTAVGSRYVNTACSISGSILVQVAGSVDVFNSQIAIIGFQINGKVLDTSTGVHTLVIKDCYLYAPDNAVSQTCVADNRTYLENCTVGSSASGTDALLNFASGGVSLISVSVTQKSAQSCLVLSGLAYFNNCALCTFTNDNAGAQLEPLVKITTAIYSVPKILANCGFIFSSLTAKPIVSGVKWNVAIWITGTNSLVSLINNTFFLYGTSISANCVESPAGNFLLSYYGNSSACSNSYGMSYTLCGALNVNKFAMFPVS